METKTTVEAQPNDLLQQCQRYFPRLAWDFDEGGVSCIAKVPSIIFDQALVVYSNGEGDFEVSIQTNLEGMRLSERLWVGADAIAQAAERWREFSAEAMAVVGPLPPPKLSPQSSRLAPRSGSTGQGWGGGYGLGRRQPD
jgi:hypothetical protein